jgi:group I intron endonuclease
MGGIYKICCRANGKVYVGSAKNFSGRWKEHQNLLNAGKHFNINLQRAWEKYGAGSFSFVILESIETYSKTEFFERENAHIDALASSGRKLFNIARAAGGWGPQTFERKDEIAAKISASLKNFAASLSEAERKALWGNARRGKPLSEYHKARTSEGLRGKCKSAETRQKMSLAQKKRAPELAIAMKSVGKKNLGKTPSNAVRFVIDGVTYNSGKDAERQLGITSRQLARMDKDGRAQRQKETN